MTRAAAYAGIGSLIGIVVGGLNHGIKGAMAGGVLGGILIAPWIGTQLADLRRSGKLRTFPGSAAISYVLAALSTYFVFQWAPTVEALLTEDGIRPSALYSILSLYLLPAAAGGCGAVLPLFVASLATSSKAQLPPERRQ